MKHSLRVAWYEAAYTKIRERLLPEAPATVTLTVGFPTKKRSGQSMCVGQCHYECIHEHGEEFGGENFIIIHPVTGDDLVNSLGVLLHEMIHHSLEPGVGHKKPFQVIAQRVGLVKPWTATLPDQDCQNILREILLELEEELGYTPTGYYVYPPPKPKKPTKKVKLRCTCAVPREIPVKIKNIQEGSVICGNCNEPFQVIIEEK